MCQPDQHQRACPAPPVSSATQFGGGCRGGSGRRGQRQQPRLPCGVSQTTGPGMFGQHGQYVSVWYYVSYEVSYMYYIVPSTVVTMK